MVQAITGPATAFVCVITLVIHGSVTETWHVINSVSTHTYNIYNTQNYKTVFNTKDIMHASMLIQSETETESAQ